MKILWVLFILHNYGKEPIAEFNSELECKLERANLIEARQFNPRYVKCLQVNVIEQKVK